LFHGRLPDAASPTDQGTVLLDGVGQRTVIELRRCGLRCSSALNANSGRTPGLSGFD
jgi:hypothetical protein